MAIPTTAALVVAIARSSVLDVPRPYTPVWLQVGLLCTGLSASPAHALQVLRADAVYEKGVFRVHFEAFLTAPVAGVAAVLGDYVHFGKLDSRIRRVELLGPQADGAVLMRTLVNACAGVFCRTVERVERVQRVPAGQVAEVVPELSDMRRGVARTHWQQQGGGTVVRYEAEFEPDFWVPGIIAQRYGVREMQESTLRMFMSVEREANDR
jgi:Polyketide cyclase / dehydrase and lipid transport